MREVERYLHAPAGTDIYLLDAWERVGRKDAARSSRVSFTRTTASTMTPLGLACLVRYARGFADERDALKMVKELAPGLSRPSRDGESKRQRRVKAR